MSATWRGRQEQWRRFAAWEASQLRSLPDDYVGALRWMSEAWELARGHDPTWGSWESAREHFRHLARVRAALAKLHPVT